MFWYKWSICQVKVVVEEEEEEEVEEVEEKNYEDM